MSNIAYDCITDRIITLLEQGTVPWQQTWKASVSFPRNLLTGKQYRGINVLLLLSASYESPFWLTFRQAMELGGSIRKGERSCPVVFWKRLTIEDEHTDEKRRIPLLRYYRVFNLAQCEGVKEIQTAGQAEAGKPEEIVAGMPKKPAIKEGFTQAFYSPREDYVGIPARERFTGTEHYHATLFHELVHATGHESRLNRISIAERAGFGSDPYCKEELTAEIGAAFLCGQAEIVDRVIDNSAAYIAGWLARMKSDKTLIIHAAAQAQRAADFILNRTFEESEAAHD